VIVSRHPRLAALYRYLDEKPAGLTPSESPTYKRPLPQLLSFDILTNARGVYPRDSRTGNFVPSRPHDKHVCKSCRFYALRTLSFSVSCNPFVCHSYEKCRVYTNNSHSGTISRRARFLPSPSQSPASLSFTLLCAVSADSASLRYTFFSLLLNFQVSPVNSLLLRYTGGLHRQPNL